MRRRDMFVTQNEKLTGTNLCVIRRRKLRKKNEEEKEDEERNLIWPLSLFFTYRDLCLFGLISKRAFNSR